MFSTQNSNRWDRLLRFYASFFADRKNAQFTQWSALSFVGDHGIVNSPAFKELYPDEYSSAQEIFKLLEDQGEAAGRHRIVELAVDYPFEQWSYFWIHHNNRFIRTALAECTADLQSYPALTTDQVQYAYDIGQKLASREIHRGVKLLIINSFGKGEELSFLCCASALQNWALADWISNETKMYLQDERLEILEKNLRRTPLSHDPLTHLSLYAGWETAATLGALTKSAELGIPYITTGLSALCAQVIAVRLNQSFRNRGLHVPKLDLAEEGNLITHEKVLSFGQNLANDQGVSGLMPLIQKLKEAFRGDQKG